jgi:uncharacterized protein (DUF1501 family)
MPTRRDVLAGLTAMSMLPTPGLASSWLPPLLVTVVLRGAMDGLHAIPAPGDPHYARARGKLALPHGALLPLEGPFAAHPALAELMPWYADGDLLVVHAAGMPYRGRSHFDGQDHLESALADRSPDTGWLGRALAAMPTPPKALAVGARTPLILQGAPRATAIQPLSTSEVDAGFSRAMAQLYGGDPLLGPAMEAALEAEALLDRQALRRGGDEVVRTFAAAGTLLSRDYTVATLEVGGWDTHARQGELEGQLANRLKQLAAGLVALRGSLGHRWDRTVVVVMTEFGLTVGANGTGGTDHGTGGIALLAGGAVNGGRVLADWPGLSSSALLDGRDLRPTTDLRAVLGGVLLDHLRVPRIAEVFGPEVVATPSLVSRG